jgi:hypothetical protein
MSAIPKSWKPSRRDGSSSLYCLIGDFVSEDLLVDASRRDWMSFVHGFRYWKEGHPTKVALSTGEKQPHLQKRGS